MTFKFMKGSQVEVWSNREVPSGSWWCAEILSGNGHTYSVRYSPCPSDMGGAVEKVLRKFIRPHPPLVKGPIYWGPGDAVEVFDKYSWKSAEIALVVGRDYYLVRLLGSSMAFRAHTSALRLRQSWEDDKWIMIGKNVEKPIGGRVSRMPKEGDCSHQMLQQWTGVKKHSADNNFPFGNDNVSKENYQGISRGGKKRPQIETHSRATKKMRAAEEERRCQRLVARPLPKLLEKVDAVASPLTFFGGKNMHASLNNRRTCFIQEELPVLEFSDTESISSSVGSYSPPTSPYRLIHPTICPTEDLASDGSPDDTETFPVSGSDLTPPTKEAVAAEIHRFELHAYRTTLAALHASGPISWEQEALISNLRLVLNISTDEHLLEIRSLIAVKNNGPLR